MKKLQLKGEVVERLNSGVSRLIKGGDTITGDSGGTLCISYCKPCPGSDHSHCDICPPPQITDRPPCASGNGCDYTSLLYSCRC